MTETNSQTLFWLNWREVTSDFAATSVPAFTSPRKGVTTFPFKKWGTAIPLNWSTASVEVQQTASGVCEVTGGTENWMMVYFTNFMVKLLKWIVSLESVLESSVVMSKFCQNVSLQVADKHYENTRFTMPLPRLPLPPQALQAELGYFTTVRITSDSNCVYTVYMSKISSTMFFVWYARRFVAKNK